MHDVLISHLREDGTVALKIALALETAGFSTCEREVGERPHDDVSVADEAIRDARTLVPIAPAPRAETGKNADARPPAAMESDIASAAWAGKPVIKLIYDTDYDVAAARGNEAPLASTHDRAVRVTEAHAPGIADRLQSELRAHGVTPGAPCSARIAELEREIGRRSNRSTAGSQREVRSASSRAHDFSWPRFALLNVYFAAIGLLLLNLDPFGMSSLSSKYSQDLLNQVFGSWYPADARDESTVVLLTDVGLDSQREPWPASYRLHARTLGAILAYGPKAVMIDIWFHDPRPDPSLAQLERTLARYRDRGIPVYAAGNLAWPDDGGIREEIGRLVTAVPVPKIADRQDRANRRYPLVVSPPVAGGSETTALRIYREVVRPSIAPLPYGAEDVAYSEEDWQVAFGDPMEVVWGTTSAPINEKSVYCSFDSDPLTVVQARMLGGDGVKSDCPYAPTLLVNDLLTSSGDEDVAALIADRVVFYGAYLEGVPDLLYPPTHLPIAGVYLHPMALDNLITFGDGYIRRAEAGGTRYAAAWGTDIVVLLAISAMIITFRSRAAIIARYPRSERILGHRRSKALIAGLPLALATMIGYAAFVLLSLAPLNWIGHLSIGGTLAAHPYERHLALLKRLGVGGLLPR